jgi:hypothetical protein
MVHYKLIYKSNGSPDARFHKGTSDQSSIHGHPRIEVIDWKTGRRLDWATGEEKTYEKLCSDPQLLLYNYAISKLIPVNHIRII